ncbi:MAG: sigma-54-dependent Fis family transcriptional regulator, partial [Gammaproteobacteria bacterium]|nr:sigma-54-dependent Fis family transcriptional regulator [Gammaproteobacteria bacterium]
TNRDLVKRVKMGEFREDLYYRLKVVEIHIPPLRERKDDIPLMVDYFIEKLNRKLGKNISSVSNDVMRLFLEYSWPGNVRELENAIEYACVLASGDVITRDNLPRDF